MKLRGRVGVITGAESHVAQSIARVLAADGMSLMLIAQPGTHVRDLAEALEQQYGVRCFPVAADVEDAEAIDRVTMHAEQHLGAIDALINTVPGHIATALRPTMEQRGHGKIIDVVDGTEATAGEVLAMLTER